MEVVHLSGYQARDEEIVDYQMYELPQSGLFFRGPAPAFTAGAQPCPEGAFVSCVGAAQTFGCFCGKPFPTLLRNRWNRHFWNLGYGGAGPRFFADRPDLIDRINNGKLLILQVMSGRSEDNGLYASGGLERLIRRRDGRSFSADNAWRDVMEGRYLWKKAPVGRKWLRAVVQQWRRPVVRRLIAETRKNWIASYRRLLDQVQVPVILLWFSKRSPDYRVDFSSLEGIFSDFPQLVDADTLEPVRNHPVVHEYVEVISRRGSPQPLFSRFSGQPVSVDLGRDRGDFDGQTWRENAYYPSPEMHEDAADALQEVLEKKFSQSLASPDESE